MYSNNLFQYQPFNHHPSVHIARAESFVQMTVENVGDIKSIAAKIIKIPHIFSTFPTC